MTSLKNCASSADIDNADMDDSHQGRDPLILVDTHVHIYDCFDIDTLLNSAWDNFYTQATHLGAQSNFVGVLLLTESAEYSCFQKLSLSISIPGQPLVSTSWKFEVTDESCALHTSDTKGKELYLIAGRQLVTADNLEVLALMTDCSFPDRLSTAVTISSIQKAGGLAVLPWGVGKWFGARGRLVKHLLHNHQLAPIFLGDNSGRPQFWRRPQHFAILEQQGWPILPGSDPLPLNGEAKRSGAFGLMMNGCFNPRTPSQFIKTALLNQQIDWQAYGQLETPWHFVSNQIALKLARKPSPSTPMTSSENQAISDFPETADIETSSENYATRFAGKIGAWLLHVQEAATLKMLADYPQARVLDVGGGHGQLTKALIEYGYDVTVLGSAEVCKARIQTYLDQQQCHFQVGNVLAMPYPDNAFDIVISYRFLAHVTQWKTFLSELTRVSKIAVLVDYPTVRSINYITPLLFKLKKGLEGNTRPYTCYNETDLIDYFESLKFSTADRYAQFALPMVIHRTLKRPKLSSFLEDGLRLTGLTRWFGSPVILKVSRS